jgi:hypothetical protein
MDGAASGSGSAGKKYVDWVEDVLKATVRAKTTGNRALVVGAREIAAQIGLDVEQTWGAVYEALADLEKLGLVNVESQYQIDITQEARKITVASLRTAWPGLQEVWLDEDQLAFLRAVCELSETRYEDYAELQWTHAYNAFERVGWERDDDRIAGLVYALRDAGLLATRLTMGGGWNIAATYASIVRAMESETSELVELVRRLIPDWETTNVEFKRELHLDKADERAEFVRDIMALANTQVTGDRFMVVGFGPRSHDFETDIDPRITGDRIEDILDRYTKPTVTLRYRPFDWLTSGRAAVLEIHRDRAKVPYRVMGAIGKERRIEHGQVYVRHGSHVVLASDDEISDLEAEAARGRS